MSFRLDRISLTKYLKCRDGNIILLSAHPILEKHDMELEILPVKKYGTNVYECIKMEMKDKRKTALEIYMSFVKIWLKIHIVLGAILLAFAFSDFPWLHSSLFLEFGRYTFMEFCGAAFSYIIVLAESKFGKWFGGIMGGLMMYIGANSLLTTIFHIAFPTATHGF